MRQSDGLRTRKCQYKKSPLQCECFFPPTGLASVVDVRLGVQLMVKVLASKLIPSFRGGLLFDQQLIPANELSVVYSKCVCSFGQLIDSSNLGFPANF